MSTASATIIVYAQIDVERPRFRRKTFRNCPLLAQIIYFSPLISQESSHRVKVSGKSTHFANEASSSFTLFQAQKR